MQYMGGKERQARHIVGQILKYRGSATRYVEPFLGGASIFSRVAPHFPGAAYGSDVHPDLVMMWQALQGGWEPPTKVSREEYNELRTAGTSALRAFAGFGCSFGGKWFGGYASNARGDDFCGAARRGVLKKAATMGAAHIALQGYEELSPGPGTLVYCDPPYAATTGYSTGPFDHDLFWSTMRNWADAGAIVLVSEYDAPEWAEEVWRRDAVKSLKKDANATPAVECLFLVPPTPVSDPAPTVEAPEAEESSMSETKLGPWFGAKFPGTCGSCGDPIKEGDRIRADGDGAYLCEDCGHQAQDERSVQAAQGAVNDWQAQASAAAKRHVEMMSEAGRTIIGPTTDDFEDPTPAREPEPEFNVSGQPRARYEWRGSVNMGYLVTDPEAGDFRRYKNGKPKGMTRATTFNKAASDNKAIGDWGKRNVAIGAALRPDVIRRAHGLTHEENRADLDRIVAELEMAAGAKVSADEGTFLHGFTEKMDAGLATWQDAPPAYHTNLKLYAECLEEHGLEPVPGLIERATMISEYGGVVGTFDRIFLHRPSGRYIIGDLKTGKTMKYAMDETETQEWIYAHGVNQNGIYDWNTDTWGPALADMLETDPEERERITISEEVGVVIHMPVQGPNAGTVTAVFADLQAGKRHADLCHAIRSRPRSRVLPFDGSKLITGEAPVPELSNASTYEIWEAQFRLIRSKAEGSELYKRARDAGQFGMEDLAALVRVGKEALQDPEPPF